MADSEEEKPDDKRAEVPRLGIRDFLALAVAAIETFLLPLLVIATVIALIALLIRIVRP